MAWQVKVLAVKPDDLSLIPRADMVDGENMVDDSYVLTVYLSCELWYPCVARADIFALLLILGELL